jgi:hypothetical protein
MLRMRCSPKWGQHFAWNPGTGKLLRRPRISHSEALFHAQFLWEWGRMIDVVFGEISVELKPAP